MAFVTILSLSVFAQTLETSKKEDASKCGCTKCGCAKGKCDCTKGSVSALAVLKRLQKNIAVPCMQRLPVINQVSVLNAEWI